jgi:hypothetical protein
LWYIDVAETFFEQDVHTTSGDASDAFERIEMRNLAENATQDVPRATKSVRRKKVVNSGTTKPENAPLNTKGTTGGIGDADGLGDTKDPDPDANVCSTTTTHVDNRAKLRDCVS